MAEAQAKIGRRGFIGAGLAGAGAALISPKDAVAGSSAAAKQAAQEPSPVPSGGIGQLPTRDVYPNLPAIPLDEEGMLDTLSRLAIRQQQVDQHAVVVLGVPHPQQAEHFERTFARRDALVHAGQRQRGFDSEHHLAAMRRLAGDDRTLDAIERRGWKRARQRTAFDVLRAGKPKPKLGRSEFIEGEAVESDEEDTLGFGGARRKPGADDEEEEDEEERNKLVEALMDDTTMSEDALKRDLVLEKFQ